MDFWKNYEEKEKIFTGGYSSIYKIKNIKTKEYVAIKEIDKNKCKINIKELKDEIKKMKLKNSDNIEIIEDKNILYLIMDLCSFNLEEYLKMRDKPFSIYEIKQFLFELNKSLKILKDEKIINGNIKLSNILININEFNKTSIKLSYYDSIKFFDKSEYLINLTDNICYTIPPEIMVGKSYNNKSDIWSLGIIIYYMLYKKYPYEGKTEYNLYENIKSNKIKKFSEDEELNDLLIKMLKEDINERINWEDYFNHSFFNKNDFPIFNIKCKNHSTQFNYYCINCKLNICDLCLNNHLSHQIIPFFQIGLNDLELNKYEILLKNIEDNINKLNKMKEEIKSFIDKIKLCKNNCNIYENDSKNNFKEYYINCLNIINDKCKIEGNINYLNIEENNIIICEYDINKDDLNKPIQILNYLNEEKKNEIENEAIKI